MTKTERVKLDRKNFVFLFYSGKLTNSSTEKNAHMFFKFRRWTYTLVIIYAQRHIPGLLNYQ